MPDIFTNKKITNTSFETMPKKLSSAIFKTGRPFNIFSTYMENPQGISFKDQKPDEKILIFMRRHPITNVPWIVLTILFLFFPFLVNYSFRIVNINYSLFPVRFIIFILIFYYLIVLGFAFANFVSWFYNIGIITQKRIIDINFSNLSQITAAATVITEVEEVKFYQPGIFASVFDYGSVHARTLAGKDDLVYTNVPHPARISDYLSKIIGE